MPTLTPFVAHPQDHPDLADALEEAFWTFDTERKRTGTERLHFKDVCRWYASRVVERRLVAARRALIEGI